MLELHAGQSGEKIIVTLTELQTLNEPYYLLRFVHVLTKNVVSVIKAPADDESLHPSRYNQFDIDTAVLFLNQPPGEWHYRMYEQASSTNIDPALASLLENGKMLLYAASEFDYTIYDTPTTFKSYQG